MEENKSLLGRKCWGVDLGKKKKAEAVLGGVVMQETIDTDGYVVCTLQIDAARATMFRRCRVFETEHKAQVFYNEFRYIYEDVDKLVDNCNSAIARLKKPINTPPQFPELAKKK